MRDGMKDLRCFLYRTIACSLPTWRSVSCHCTIDQGSHGC